MILGNSGFSPWSHNVAVTRMLREGFKLSQGVAKLERGRQDDNVFPPIAPVMEGKPWSLSSGLVTFCPCSSESWA